MVNSVTYEIKELFEKYRGYYAGFRQLTGESFHPPCFRPSYLGHCARLDAPPAGGLRQVQAGGPPALCHWTSLSGQKQEHQERAASVLLYLEALRNTCAASILTCRKLKWNHSWNNFEPRHQTRSLRSGLVQILRPSCWSWECIHSFLQQIFPENLQNVWRVVGTEDTAMQHCPQGSSSLWGRQLTRRTSVYQKAGSAMAEG